MSGEPSVKCPFCGSDATIPVVYGLPGPELGAQAGRGEVALGGCLVTVDGPARSCTDCGGTFIGERP